MPPPPRCTQQLVCMFCRLRCILSGVFTRCMSEDTLSATTHVSLSVSWVSEIGCSSGTVARTHFLQMVVLCGVYMLGVVCSVCYDLMQRGNP